ncbi:GDSL Lipase/Acylhydrolase [Ephemerocybe angulata]|uniref:GDSL Lipase/Acylhydrolase n=1 Tax=Ephemerocybe angulata TaxID=980116 RepID=A0A8H6IHX1_9AGAR|nr:GDSL Lipase/Acylhydrolase [Tulosesus angulatus]
MSAYVQDVFMLFGDSITQGAWAPGDTGIGQRLSHVYARKLDVLNRGYSGYNTEWGLPILDQCIAKPHDAARAPKIKVLTIWFGANDACIKPSPQHVPLERFIANLQAMITLVRERSPETRIILITAPPVNTIARKADLESRDPPQALDRLFDTSKAYADATKALAAEHGVGVVDAWGALWTACGEEEAKFAEFSGDGLHLNARGYEVVYHELIKVISERYPDVHPDKLESVFPLWKDIDWASPQSSLYVVRRE